ncbi:hypothetical protein [Shewanella sp. HL-SH2]|uniref:hypothetical protein n=1 Tax=Shewanella sp. HL-SH2 TaxID=3436238 RepID=UPI003EB7D4EA
MMRKLQTAAVVLSLLLSAGVSAASLEEFNAGLQAAVEAGTVGDYTEQMFANSTAEEAEAILAAALQAAGADEAAQTKILAAAQQAGVSPDLIAAIAASNGVSASVVAAATQIATAAGTNNAGNSGNPNAINAANRPNPGQGRGNTGGNNGGGGGGGGDGVSGN